MGVFNFGEAVIGKMLSRLSVFCICGSFANLCYLILRTAMGLQEAYSSCCRIFCHVCRLMTTRLGTLTHDGQNIFTTDVGHWIKKRYNITKPL